ncbi:unnamed protein product [Linum trigynum]|uniref:Uncharacterized protein n=1 Tax=Linum trigynum TaxID=586398 RepID=A0AAV2G362_9ROSI
MILLTRTSDGWIVSGAVTTKLANLVGHAWPGGELKAFHSIPFINKLCYNEPMSTRCPRSSFTYISGWLA